MIQIDDIYQRFVESCRTLKIIRPEDFVLAAVSGGSDSTAMLNLLLKWQKDDGGFNLAVAHFNHRIRKEADDDQHLVETMCRENNIKCFCGSGNVPNFARKFKLSIHAAARRLRYQFLVDTVNSWADEIGPGMNKLIATGHQSDDQVETALMKLFSGSGVEGLSSIRRCVKVKGIPKVQIVRPVLDFSRNELKGYCEIGGLLFCIDSSNKDLRYPRNRIRHLIIPGIVEKFDPSAINGIRQTAERIQLAEEVISAKTREAWVRAVTHRTESEVELDYKLFSSYLTMLRIMLLQRAARVISDNACRPGYNRLVTADRYLLDDRKGEIELGDNIRVYSCRGRIYIYRILEHEWNRKLELGSDIIIDGYGRLSARSIGIDAVSLPPPAMSLFCDQGKTGTGPFIVTPAKAGDRIVPLGMTGRVKVSEVLRDAGIPPHRRHYPIIRIGDEVAAIPPFRIADKFKITQTTQDVVEFKQELLTQGPHVESESFF